METVKRGRMGAMALAAVAMLAAGCNRAPTSEAKPEAAAGGDVAAGPAPVKIADDVVAMIDYTLTDDTGKVLDSSAGRAPLPYMHGHHNLIPGLERELAGKGAGDHFVAVIKPEDAYGVLDAKLIQAIPRSNFPASEKIQPGVQFYSNTGQVVTVIKADEKTVTVDANHPLADKTLHFDVTVKSLRAPTAAEVKAGRVGGG